MARVSDQYGIGVRTEGGKGDCRSLVTSDRENYQRSSHHSPAYPPAYPQSGTTRSHPWLNLSHPLSKQIHFPGTIKQSLAPSDHTQPEGATDRRLQARACGTLAHTPECAQEGSPCLTTHCNESELHWRPNVAPFSQAEMASCRKLGGFFYSDDIK